MRSHSTHRLLTGFILVMGLVIFLLLAGCSSSRFTLPPVTALPSGEYLYGKFVWRDLLTYDVNATRKFYGELFGWQFRESNRGNYLTIIQNGVPIGGIVYVEEIKKKHYRAQWMSYLSVPDVDSALALVQEMGGTVLRKPQDIPQRGRFAIVRDSQGALLALLHTTAGDPPDREIRDFEWLWEENLTENVTLGVEFYTRLVGYTAEPLNNPQIADTSFQYYVLKKDGKPRAGITHVPWQGVKPNWLPYIKVSDLQSLMEKVEKLGGKIYLAPHSEVRQGKVALIADPTGAVVALQIWLL